MLAAIRTIQGQGLRPIVLGAWCLLPALEVLGVSLAFDAGVLLRGDGALSGPAALIAWAPQIGRVLVAFAFAMLLHGGREWWDEVRRLWDAGRVRPTSAWLRAAMVHVLAFVAFVVLTRDVLTPNALEGAAGQFVGWAWPVTALGVLATWALILAPAPDWAEILRRRSASIAAGAAIALLACVAGLLTQSFWEPLADATLATSRYLLSWAVPVVVIVPELRRLGTPEFQVNIAPACSGYEGIGLLWAVLGTYLWLSRSRYRFPACLLLFPIGTALIWVANSIRIAALILVGSRVSRELALGGFHSQAGWIALNGVTLGLIAVASRWPWIRNEHGSTEGDADTLRVVNPTAPFLAPLAAVLAVALATSSLAAAGSPDALYVLRVVVGFAVLYAFRADYRGQWGPVGVRELLRGGLVGLAVFAIWMALEPASAGRSGPPPAMLGWTRPWFVAWVGAKLVGSILLIPIVEELAFRGFAARRLISAEFETLPLGAFTWPSWILSSLLFGAMHDRLLAGTLAGLCYGWSVRRAGSLWEAIFAHAVTNALIAAAVLLNGSWSLW